MIIFIIISEGNVINSCFRRLPIVIMRQFIKPKYVTKYEADNKLFE